MQPSIPFTVVMQTSILLRLITIQYSRNEILLYILYFSIYNYNYERIYDKVRGGLQSIVGFENTKNEMERESLLRQADHMWKMLDNMAENNPEGYQRFIKKQLGEGSAHFKPPEPVFCLRCEIDMVSILFKH